MSAHKSRVEIGFQDNDNINDRGEPQWTLVDNVPYNEPILFILGGNGTKTGRNGCNGYATRIKNALAQNMNARSVANLKIYGAAYDFGRIDIGKEAAKKFKHWELQTHRDGLARRLKFEEYGHKRPVELDTKMVPDADAKNEKLDLVYALLIYWLIFSVVDSVYADYIWYILERFQELFLADTLDPQYVHQIFDTLLLPRISDNGKKLDKDEVVKRIRNVTIWAHCHGAYVFWCLEELMQKKMAELGYAPSEMRDIQKQLFCVSYAPMMPLGQTKSTVLSFASMYDLFLVDKEGHKNIFTWYMKNYRLNVAVKDQKNGMIGDESTQKEIYDLAENPKINLIAYFPEKQGNIFVFPHLGDNFNFNGLGLMRGEHNLEYKEKNPYALIWRTFMANALGNGLKSSVYGTLLPDVKDLVTKLDYAGLDIKDTTDYRHARNFMELDEETNAGSGIVTPKKLRRVLDAPEEKYDENIARMNKELSVFEGLYNPTLYNTKLNTEKQDIKQLDEQTLLIIFDTAKQNGIDIYNEMKKLRFIKGRRAIEQQIGTTFLQDNFFIKQTDSHDK